MISSSFRARACVAAVLFFSLSTACASGTDTQVTDPAATYSTIQVNASTSPAYVTLGETAVATILTGDPTASAAWDLAFTAEPAVSVNGGASGSGGVRAYCICQNASLTLAQVQALGAVTASDAFGAVSASSIGTDAQFQADVASQAISGWYDYNASTHVISANSTVWGIRLASTSGAYAKFHVSAIPSPAQASAGPVTIQWAIQASSTGALGADKQAIIDLSSGAKLYVNLTTGLTSSSSSSAWDIALQGYTITVNGGAGGSGNVGAVPLVPSSFYASYASITAIPIGATGIPSTSFISDGAGGAFRANVPYRYDPVSHQVYPTFDVYLVKRGTTVYKVQVISYYSTGGVFGYVTLRYARITG